MPQPAKGTRAFQDAASYNQHLAQHQAYTAQAQAASANTFRNPYLTPNNTQPSTQPPAYTQDASYAPSAQPQQQQAQQQHATTQTQAQAQTGGQQVQYNVNSSAPFNHRVSAHQTSAQMIPSNSMPRGRTLFSRSVDEDRRGSGCRRSRCRCWNPPSGDYPEAVANLVGWPKIHSLRVFPFEMGALQRVK